MTESEATKKKMKDLSKNICDRVKIIGTQVRYVKYITEHWSDELFRDYFSPIVISLQTSIYIELFKIFDKSGPDTKKYNIYALINICDEDSKKRFNRILSSYNNDIESICECRNKIFAHNTTISDIDITRILSENVIVNQSDLLKAIIEICCDVNDELILGTELKNARIFEKYTDYCLNMLNVE